MQYFLDNLSNLIGFYTKYYERIILMCDFNLEVADVCLIMF